MIEYWKRNILNCWNIFSRNYILLITPCFLSLIMLFYVSVSINDTPMPMPKIILMIALSLISIGVHIGSISVTYRAIIGEKITFKDIFKQFDKLHLILIPNIGLFAILFILVTNFSISSYLLILITGALYFSFLYFYDYLIIIEKLTIKEAIMKNYYLVSNNLALVLQFVLISFLIGFCLSIFQIIGSVLAMCFIRIIGINLFLAISKSIKVE